MIASPLRCAADRHKSIPSVPVCTLYDMSGSNLTPVLHFPSEEISSGCHIPVVPGLGMIIHSQWVARGEPLLLRRKSDIHLSEGFCLWSFDPVTRGISIITPLKHNKNMHCPNHLSLTLPSKGKPRISLQSDTHLHGEGN